VTETLGGIREVKVAHKEEHFLADFAERRGRFARASFTAGWLGSLPRIAIETMFVLFIVTFLLLSGKDQQSAAGAVPVLGLFAYAVLRMLPSVNRVVQAVTQLRYGIAGLDYIYDDLMTATERAPIPVDQITPLVFADALRLDNVWFRYESSPDWVLQNVDLVLRPGECIGLVGSTGSGKTTLVDVICGLLDPARGVVSVDGQEIGDCLLAWQASLGMVPQSIFLADASIRRNIAFGLGDDQADDGKVHRAIEQAQLLDFVASLPAGIDTMVGEAGVRLSGGQRQRIAIARALYDDPAVLIFDEGTSALDNATERQVLDTLEGLRSSRTMIIVAHRLSTVKTCDRLLLLEKGVITGQGAFDELVESSPDFRRMAH
jgi:ATP-binding cassette subfamily C protein